MNKHKTSRQFFPDPTNCLDDGLVAVSEYIDTDLLYEAYSYGIFPWPYEESPILWFCPDQRGILFLNEYKPSRSFQKFLKKTNFRIEVNRNFDDVIDQCSKVPRTGQDGTWITEPLKKAYKEFHKLGFAKSIECYENQELIGGMYGVFIGGVFSGESMFYKKPNASKYCLHYLIEYLKENKIEWLDIQMITPHMKKIGATSIPRRKFLKLLKNQQLLGGSLDGF